MNLEKLHHFFMEEYDKAKNNYHYLKMQDFDSASYVEWCTAPRLTLGDVTTDEMWVSMLERQLKMARALRIIEFICALICAGRILLCAGKPFHLPWGVAKCIYKYVRQNDDLSTYLNEELKREKNFAESTRRAYRLQYPDAWKVLQWDKPFSESDRKRVKRA